MAGYSRKDLCARTTPQAESPSKPHANAVRTRISRHRSRLQDSMSASRCYPLCWRQMRVFLLSLFAAGSVLAQFQDLATPDDGSALYFSSALRLAGSDQYLHAKLFLMDPAGIHLYAQQAPATVSVAPRRTSINSSLPMSARTAKCWPIPPPARVTAAAAACRWKPARAISPACPANRNKSSLASCASAGTADSPSPSVRPPYSPRRPRGSSTFSPAR